MAQACNPSTLGGRGGWIMRSRDRHYPGQHGETPSLLKLQKISWAWWRVPVIPATLEAEAGELPEPSGRRLWWAKIAPLHSSLGNKSKTPFQKKKKKREVSLSHSFIQLFIYYMTIPWEPIMCRAQLYVGGYDGEHVGCNPGLSWAHILAEGERYK